MAKKLSKKVKMAESGILKVFLAITSAIFNILQNGFSLVHQWFQALLLMYNTTIFEKNNFSFPQKAYIKPRWYLRFAIYVFGVKWNTLVPILQNISSMHFLFDIMQCLCMVWCASSPFTPGSFAPTYIYF